MIKKIIAIGIISMFLLTSCSVFAGAHKDSSHTGTIDQDGQPEPIVIRVCIVKSAFLTMGCSVGKSSFAKELDNYSWTVGDQTYIINLTQISRRQNSPVYMSDLLNYKKIKKNYDVILISGIQDEQILSGLPITRNSLRMKILKRNLQRFVKEGGGFIGHCGGSTVPIRSAYNEPRTLSEYVLYKGFFSDVDVKVYCHTGMPILCEHGYLNRIFKPRNWLRYTLHPEYMGYLGYLYYNAFHSPCGIPMNLNIRDNDHPLFRGYLDDTLLIRWGGGPAYIVPVDNPNVSNLADYPYEEDPYVNESTRINYWTFNEPFSLIQSGLATLVGFRFFPKISDFIIRRNGKWNSAWNLTDWDRTDIPIITDHANHSALVTFNYPEGDENGGRVLICGCHPEICIWEREGNYIRMAEDDDDNHMREGLIEWVNDSGTPGDPSDDRLLNKSDYIDDPLCWFVRREAAWAYGKVPDDHFPPVYGRSEVVDIDPILQELLEFTIDCTVGKENGEVWNNANLSLYYRYNGSNSDYTWIDWTCYDSIHAPPWRFTFNTTKAYGLGNYEFYSILNTTDASGNYNCELPPPGADAACVLGEMGHKVCWV
ncbi:MAG: hypothetical protein KAW45_03230 [Thermoplasmatales archaeon]|nr:hypothetical protein [Thermoplasmatales archaeon]